MKKSIVILGGGIAGLGAGRELAKSGAAITLLEAQDRLGGRIFTRRHADIPIELGAEFIHGENKTLLGAIADAKLATQPVNTHSRLSANGHFEALPIGDQASKVLGRINPAMPDLSFEQFLNRQDDLDDSVKNSVRHYVEGFNAAYADRISAHALWRAEQAASAMNGSAQYRLLEGYAALVDVLSSELTRLGGRILTGRLVKWVVWRNRSAEVFAETAGGGERFTADAAIVSVPLGVWKTNSITFAPPIRTKMDAAMGLKMGNVVKVIFQFRQPFWNDTGFIHTFDQRLPTWWNDPRGPILTAWAAGPHADALLEFPPARLEQIGLELLGKIFSAPAARLRNELVAAHYWNWAIDPQARGAYSYIPVNGMDLPRQLAEPIAETLFFAGEATVADAQMGTVFGALESGLRAAREVLASS